jgi:hypothetical protein
MLRPTILFIVTLHFFHFLNAKPLSIPALVVSQPSITEWDNLSNEELYTRYTQEKPDLKQCSLLFPVDDGERIIDYIEISDIFMQNNFSEVFSYCSDKDSCELFRKGVIVDCYKVVKDATWTVDWSDEGVPAERSRDTDREIVESSNSIHDTTAGVHRHTASLVFDPRADKMKTLISDMCLHKAGYDESSFKCDYFKALVYQAALKQQVFVSLGLNVPVSEYRRVFDTSLFLDETRDNPPHCTLSRKRHLISHHKSGTNVALALMMTVNHNFCSSCLLDIHIEGLNSGYDDFHNSYIVHFIRNPFDMILSGYFYHIKWGEAMVIFPMCALVLPSKDLKFWSNYHSQFPSILKVYEYILDHPETYPDPGQLSYREYLTSVSPRLGVQLEYIRSISGNVLEMVQDMITLDTIGGEDSDSDSSVVSSVCMTVVMKSSPEHGSTNDWIALRHIATDFLDIPLTEDMEMTLANQFFSEEASELRQAHSTDRNQLRLDLLSVIRDFDRLEENNGVVHAYEQIINCPSEYQEG